MTDPGLTGAVERLEETLLGARPTLTRVEVAARAGVPLEQAIHLWHLLGFATVGDDVPAFTEADVVALQHTQALIDLGVLDRERQDGLIRTWGRSFARLADWQVALLTDVSDELGIAPEDGTAIFTAEVLPRVEALQSFVWQRHLMSAWSRLLVEHEPGAARAVCFVDIVGYTSRSKTLSDRDLVAWLEQFESTALDVALGHGGHIIKNIGDELLLVVETPAGAAAIALELTRRGEDPADPFPAVRAGVAYGDVVLRLGDVYGPVVNVAARLTSVARPGTVLVDEGMFAALTGQDAVASDATDHGPEAGLTAPPSGPPEDAAPYDLRRVRRVSVKGYSRLRVWRLRDR